MWLLRLPRFEKSLPSREGNFLVVSREMVQAPQAELERFLADPDQIRLHQERYRVKAAEELIRLEEFLRGSGADCFRRREISGSPERLRIVARLC